MHKEHKIHFLNFQPDSKENLENILTNTSYKNSIFYTAANVEDVINSDIFDQLDLIITYSTPKESISSDSFKKIINIIPVLFVYEGNLEDSTNCGKINDIYDCIPEKELTAFILEKCISHLLEKNNIKFRLNDIENVQEKVYENEEKFRDLFDNSSVGMYEVDKDGNFILANQVFFKILGISSHSELKKFNAFKAGISTNGTREKLRKLLDKKDNVVNFEDEWLKADDSKIMVKENIRVKKDDNGNIQYYQGVVEDISNRKYVESELVQSKKDAEKSDQLKSEFLTQISHEIRTPVNTLLSFVSLIEEELHESLSDELIGCFEHLNKAGKRITRTIDLLIKMSELHTDNYDPEFTENDLFKVFEDLMEIYKPLADEKNLKLEFVKGIDSANIVFDKLTVNDIFSNLIDNAIKFTDKGTVKIYVKNSLLNKVAVTVLDTGVGISPKYLGNIFQPFSQETSGYTRKFDGNGLGMTLVKEYCDLNNAEIFVSSEKNLGSNFTVVFR